MSPFDPATLLGGAAAVAMQRTLGASVAQLAKGYWHKLNGTIRVFEDHEASEADFSRRALRQAGQQTLLVSAQDLRFVFPALTRIVQTDWSAPDKVAQCPRIERFVVRRLSKVTIQQLQGMGALDAGFLSRLESNLQAIHAMRSPCFAFQKVEVFDWPGLAPIHGVLWGQYLIAGKWSVGDDRALRCQSTIVVRDHAKTRPFIQKFTRAVIEGV